ncbi:MAG: ABC transporter substrate-binding protein [Prosthecobacter sp.]|jgi:NitT/TauT family transport system substrate-binding protein|uniref:ABC transporter substrate-binding protein n=1 Tax=Prosthecobacter sp. TaxID=1965333 RepID=UPI001A08BD09|nr:ABC transporter substrate-binding protein [Prosthecobacter sp.]MBE2284583.1 ABC transporter substrate-binding protein [Prosthecobacter sp.]
MNRRAIITLAVPAAVALAFWAYKHESSPASRQPQATPSLTKITINEAARTLLYLPLYHAVERGFFNEAGIEVNIVTGGTATASFAAMTSGEAEFAQADPMYVPISREKGAKTKVVAQVVGRIAVWGTTLVPDIKELNAASLKGRTISTHPRPMTAFTYAEKLVKDVGLQPEVDVKFLTSKPGTELAALLNHQADILVSLEPTTSLAEMQGAHVVHSFPSQFGDQVFTALMTREELIATSPDLVKRVVACYQRALDDIHSDANASLKTAIKYFPQLDLEALKMAIARITADQVIPKSVTISKESWDKAAAVRVAAGDIKQMPPIEDSVVQP